MTQKELVLAQPYYDGLRWHNTVGEPFDTSKLDEKLVEKLTRKGFLMSARAYKAKLNPEAAQAQAKAEASDGELQRIFAALPGVTTPDGAIAAIEDLRQRSATDQADLAAAQVFNQGLRTLYPQAKTAKDLLKAAQESHAGSAGLTQERDDLRTQLETATARIAALEKVHAVEGGTELPQNFTGRGRLTQLGLTTYESLRGKTAAQLDAVEGLTPDHAAKIVDAVEKHFAEAE